MYKKLDDENISAILEAGIQEFGENGLDRSSINQIAKRAGVSVGVIYKYFEGKDDFFLQCVKHSLKLLDEVLFDAVGYETDISAGIESVVRALIKYASEHASYNALYNEVSAGSCKQYASLLAQEIETRSAKAYSRLLENAQRAGKAEAGFDPRYFAFFIDNLFMMLQYSYSCDYYRERMRIYCGDDVFESREKMIEQFMRFVRAALKA